MARQILVCDDEVHILYAISFKLAAAGFDILQAGNGREAIALLETHRPDLVIMDYQMPHVNGLELCRHLRGRPDTADIPVIMLTAKALELNEEMVKAQWRLEAILMKPFSPRNLLATVEGIFASSTAAAASNT